MNNLQDKLKDTWKFDFFGDGYTIVVTGIKNVSWFRRIITKLIFGSKWTKL